MARKFDLIVDIEPDWVHLDTDENGIRMNSYFVQHPEMILGDMQMVSGRFGQESTCVPYENADLESLLDEAVANIHGEIDEYEQDEELEEEDNSIPADPTVRNFSYTLLDDVIYFRENSRMSPVDMSATAENRIKGLIQIRNSVRHLLEFQTEDYPSCIAAKVAAAHTTIALYFKSMNDSVSGKQNNSAPVTLFITECTAIILLYLITTEMILMILISAITAIQIYSHIGMSSIGSSLVRHTATKRRSAAVSSFAPNALTVFVFRATVPSIISVNPAAQYST